MGVSGLGGVDEAADAFGLKIWSANSVWKSQLKDGC